MKIVQLKPTRYIKVKIIKNRAMCLLCGEIIESKYRHNFVTCKCGNLSVDGGHDYLKRSADDLEKYQDMSICEEDTENK